MKSKEERRRTVLEEAKAIARAEPVPESRALARLLAVALRKKRESEPVEPWEPVPEPLERARQLLDAYEVAVRELDERPPLGVFTLRAGPDRQLYAHAIVELIDEAERRGRAKLAAELADEGDPDECACRCRAHFAMGCALCVRVERCPVHGDDDPGRVSPRWRKEHGDATASEAIEPDDDASIVGCRVHPIGGISRDAAPQLQNVSNPAGASVTARLERKRCAG